MTKKLTVMQCGRSRAQLQILKWHNMWSLPSAHLLLVAYLQHVWCECFAKLQCFLGLQFRMQFIDFVGGQGLDG